MALPAAIGRFNRYIKSVIERQPGKVSTVMEFDPGMQRK